MQMKTLALSGAMTAAMVQLLALHMVPLVFSGMTHKHKVRNGP